MNLTIGVISDLHCHARNEHDGRTESFLIANDLREPADRHPVQSLLGLITREQLTADIVVCPGDLAHKASREGLVAAFGHLREISDALGAGGPICTLGNHDVESRQAGADPFATAKRAHPAFPFLDRQLTDRYWAAGFAVQRLPGNADIVVVNTAMHHYGDVEARRGTFPDAQIRRLEEALEAVETPALRVALLHHHPVLHTVAGFDATDVLPNGDDLVRVLARAGTRLVIHGHRHHPRLKRELVDGISVFVLAAGSFAVFLNELSSRTRNVFHLVEVEAFTGTFRGRVLTWEFNYARGWHPTSIRSSEFPHTANFGEAPPLTLADDIAQFVRGSSPAMADGDMLRTRFPELAGLIPEELLALSRTLVALGASVEFSDEGAIRLVAKIG